VFDVQCRFSQAHSAIEVSSAIFLNTEPDIEPSLYKLVTVIWIINYKNLRYM
jgi:hypothetical protein